MGDCVGHILSYQGIRAIVVASSRDFGPDGLPGFRDKDPLIGWAALTTLIAAVQCPKWQEHLSVTLLPVAYGLLDDRVAT